MRTRKTDIPEEVERKILDQLTDEVTHRPCLCSVSGMFALTPYTLHFGTYFLSSRQQYEAGYRIDFDTLPPDMAAVLKHETGSGYKGKHEAGGFNANAMFMTESYQAGAMVVYELSKWRDGKEVWFEDTARVLTALNLSGILQLGEHFNRRNLSNYTRLRNLKYLPFLITGHGYAFSVYYPTAERVATGIADFERALEIIEPYEPLILQIVEEGQAWRELVRFEKASPHVTTAIDEVEARLNEMAQPLRRKLSFLMREVQGPKDTFLFHNDIYRVK